MSKEGRRRQVLSGRPHQPESVGRQNGIIGEDVIESPALEISYAYLRGEQASKAGQAVIASASDMLLRPFAAIETHLETHSHMVGGRFTVADINMAELVRYAQAHGPLMDRFPRLKRGIELCQSRPAFQKMWKTREAEPA